MIQRALWNALFGARKMAYIPPDAEWYIAEIVEEIIVANDDRNVIHRNLVLINAHSPDEAYNRAIALGKGGETEYENPLGQRVVIKFRGLSSLDVIHDLIEHGAELRFLESVSVPEAEIIKLLKSKEQLEVFQDIGPRRGPDYASKEVVDEAIELMAKNRVNPI